MRRKLNRIKYPFGEEAEVILAAADGEFGPATWIADSGASTHMGNIDEGMMDVVEINEPIKVGNGNKARAIKKGTLPLMLMQRNGDTLDIKLKDYKYSPELGVCLFSLTKAIEKGWLLSNKEMNIILTKGKHRIVFDKVVRTKDGILCGVDLVTQIKTANEAKQEQANLAGAAQGRAPLGLKIPGEEEKLGHKRKRSKTGLRSIGRSTSSIEYLDMPQRTP